LRPGLLKIVTFNINNINKRLDNLVAWLAKTEPDIVCLQELKAEQRAFFRHIPFEPLAIVQSGKASVLGTVWRSSRETTIRC